MRYGDSTGVLFAIFTHLLLSVIFKSPSQQLQHKNDVIEMFVFLFTFDSEEVNVQ